MRIYILILTFSLFFSCTPPQKLSYLAGIQITDRNGFTETITTPQEVKKYENEDYFSPQPYERVILTIQSSKETTPSKIFTYHPNGNIKEFLESINFQAKGTYKKFFSSGQIEIEAQLVGGVGDLTEEAKKTWIFHGKSQVYSKQGVLLACMGYSNGLLEGESKFFWDSGQLKESSIYTFGKKNGVYTSYYENKQPKLIGFYKNGHKEGLFSHYSPSGTLVSKEEHFNQRLINASYYDSDTLVSSVINGSGKKIVFSSEGLTELFPYTNGKINGVARQFSKEKFLLKSCDYLEGVKHGKELFFLPNSKTPYMSISWDNNTLNGPVSTYFPDGKVQSIFSIKNKLKDGSFKNWSTSGFLMFHEEYTNGLLNTGKYFKSGVNTPVSEIKNGKGTALFFDEQGSLLAKENYEQGEKSS